MRIGLDLDGVVIDSEKTFCVYSEIYACDVINKKIVNREEPKHFGRYELTEEENKDYINNYLLRAAKESPLMPGFLPVFERLKKMGHEFVVITARGGMIPEMKDDAIRILKENNIIVDKCYFNTSNKLKICQEEKVDVMIDDDYHIVDEIASNHIKTLYFRDTNIKKLEENEYIHEVNNWGDIYRYFKELDR